MTAALLESALLLIHVIFGFCTFILLTRFLAELGKLNPYNPLGQVILSLTEPVLRIIRPYIPRINGKEYSLLLLLYLLEFSKLLLLMTIHTQGTYTYGSDIWHLLIWPITSLLGFILNYYMWAIIIQVILSLLIFLNFAMIAPNNALFTFLVDFVDPILRPFRRLLPMMQQVDLSPLLALLTLKIAGFFLLALFPVSPWL